MIGSLVVSHSSGRDKLWDQINILRGFFKFPILDFSAISADNLEQRLFRVPDRQSIHFLEVVLIGLLDPFGFICEFGLRSQIESNLFDFISSISAVLGDDRGLFIVSNDLIVILAIEDL